MSQSRGYGPGHFARGFQRSEERETWGGRCWRRWEPHQPSSDLGSDYESWQWPGAHATLALEMLRGRGIRPSRIDWAHDFEVPDDFTSGKLLRAVRPHLRRRRLEPEWAGRQRDGTLYVGSKSSERRLRCYRKDLQDPNLLAISGPTMRLEVVVLDEHARALSQAYDRDPVEGASVAAAHLADLCGVRVLNLGVVPARAECPELEACQLLLSFIDQHSGMLKLAADLGLDLAGLAEARSERWNDEAWRRFRRRCDAFFKGVGGPSAVVRKVRAVLDLAAERRAVA